jgi:prophage antirepressor-like protein
MSSPLTFQTVEFSVIDHKGKTWLRAADIAQALGYSRTDKVSRIYRTHANEFTSEMTAVVELPDPEHLKGVPGLTRNARIFSLRGAYLLGMFARTPKAEAFRRWVLDVLEGVTRAPADLHARLIEAEQAEAKSFAVAQACSKGMNRRRVEKSRLLKRIDALRELVQMALPLEGGAA